VLNRSLIQRTRSWWAWVLVFHRRRFASSCLSVPKNASAALLPQHTPVRTPRLNHTEPRTKCTELSRGVLRSVITMEHYFVGFSVAGRDCRTRGASNEFGVYLRCDGSVNYSAGMEIDHCGQEQSALSSLWTGAITSPDPVRSRRIESGLHMLFPCPSVPVKACCTYFVVSGFALSVVCAHDPRGSFPADPESLFPSPAMWSGCSVGTVRSCPDRCDPVRELL